tara:strand:+ start:415 stop:888 length:474 start_codon:yes stop_codon:yes gene_type:complete
MSNGQDQFYDQTKRERTDVETAGQAGAKAGALAGTGAALGTGASLAAGLATAGALTSMTPIGWTLLAASVVASATTAGVAAGKKRKAEIEGQTAADLATKASREAQKEQQKRSQAVKTRKQASRDVAYAPTSDPMATTVPAIGSSSSYDDFLSRNMA